MNHNLELVMILTVGFTLASVLGYLAQRLSLPSILGYLLAGFFIGPYSPGFVANITISEQLAEIGVILMLFGVGLHFKLEDLMNVKQIAIPGAIVQTLAATLVSILIVYGIGWSLEAGLIIGLSVGVASTVVLVRVLSDNHLLDTIEGHIAVGWLIVEDIFTIIILILLPSFAILMQSSSMPYMMIGSEILIALAKFIVLVLLMFTWGHKLVAFALTLVARLRSQELFTLAVLSVVFLIATGSTIIFGTSIALGAFIAGMVVGKTSVKHQAAANALPIKDIFTIIFFLSVGMLFNPAVIMNHFTLFLGLMGVILIVKPLAAFLITIGLGYSLKIALTISLALAQIGEFSFILAEEAMRLKLLPDEGFDILVACALVSISLNPLLFQLIDIVERHIQKTRFFKVIRVNIEKIEKFTHLFSPKILVIGLGPIGKEVIYYLNKSGFNPVVIENNIDTTELANNQDSKNLIVFGDASQDDILKAVHIETMRLLVITIPDTTKAIEIIRSARSLNPEIRVIMRIQYIAEEVMVEDLGVEYICAERESLRSFVKTIQNFINLKT
jgi:monovalent cation:H+ antiporter-2, CPA2 family